MDTQALLALLLSHQFAGPEVLPLEGGSPTSILKDQSANSILPSPEAASFTSTLKYLPPAPPPSSQKAASLSSTRKVHPPDPLFSPPEAASYLGICENTLSVWRCVGRYNIEYIKVGRLVRYRKSALDAFLERRTRGQVEGI
jgi:excisionase family DNA binding protein